MERGNCHGRGMFEMKGVIYCRFLCVLKMYKYDLHVDARPLLSFIDIIIKYHLVVQWSVYFCFGIDFCLVS